MARHWRAQLPADRALIEECKSPRPRFKKILLALKNGARWERGVDVDRARLAVHCCALNVRAPQSLDLIRAAGADFLALDRTGATFFHCAVANNNLISARWWLDQGFAIDAKNGAGRSAFEMCFENGNGEMAALLLRERPDELPASAIEHALYDCESLMDDVYSSEWGLQEVCEAVGWLALIQPNRRLSDALDRLAFHDLARVARDQESRMIALSERDSIQSALPPEPLAAPSGAARRAL